MSSPQAHKILLSKAVVTEEMKQAVLKVMDSGRFVRGSETDSFEREFASFHGVGHGVSVSSGTAALQLALLACGVKDGDEVITVSHTFVATAEVIVNVACRPVLVDIDPRYYTINPEEVKSHITRKTRVIIPVHLYGHPVDMDPILELADQHGLYVIEDACQAHGAQYKGAYIGRLGDIGCFSFYPSKNMTVCGEGGMIITDNGKFADQIRRLSDHGRESRNAFSEVGSNYRMGEIAAAIGRLQLKRLNEWIERRRRIAALYSSSFAKVDGLEIPLEAEWAYHAYHLYVCRTRWRDQLCRYLGEQGIETGVYYPIPIHKQPPYVRLDTVKDVSLPVTEKAAQEVVALPMHPSLSDGDVGLTVNLVKNFLQKR